MTDQSSFPTADALDALVAKLLDCGGALSQMIGGMQEFEACEDIFFVPPSEIRRLSGGSGSAGSRRRQRRRSGRRRKR